MAKNSLFSNKKGMMHKMLNFPIGLVVLAAGALPLLKGFGMLTGLPPIPIIVVQIVAALAGILLILESFMDLI